MGNEHIELFPPQVRGEAKVALHPSGRSFEYSPDILACTSLFPPLFQQMRGERIRSLEIFAPLIERLADIYQIAPPTLGNRGKTPHSRCFARIDADFGHEDEGIGACVSGIPSGAPSKGPGSYTTPVLQRELSF
jgi:hypothetical protein